MESIDLDMGDIFDEEAMDDDVGAVSALPDLPEYREEGEGGEQGDNEDNENTEVLARLKDLSKGAAKKRVSRPQPKLDATRLTGERGIPILPKAFEKVKFKGRGHEAEDLASLMRNLEHWAHRLFPKMPFDEVLERAERLGAKREVQTCVKKMRLDMPILNDDFVGSDKEEEDDVIRQGDDIPPQAKTAQELEDDWDELIREAEESQASQTPSRPSHSAPGPSHASQGPSQATPGPSQGTPGLRYDTPGPTESTEESQLSTPAPQRTTTDSPFTPDQLERMERNKQMAREKRLAKLGIRSPATPMLSRPAPAGSLSTQRGPDSQVLPSQTTQGDQTDRITSPHSQTGSQSTQRGPDSQTFPSQTTQGDQTDRITSPHSQTGSQSTQRSPDSQTFPSQTTQGDQTDRVTSPHSQTGSTTRVTSEGEKSDIQTTKDSEETLVDTSRQTEMDSEDNEMSEVIRTQNEKVKVNRRLQDAQNWCTEPPETESTENDSLETDSIPMTYAKKTLHGNDSVKDKRDSAIDSSQKSTENGVNESENGVVNGHDNHTETQFDSEEMSEVIPFQDAGKIPLAPELGTQNTESMNEMSEVIERQDYHRSSEHNNKENMASGDLKLKDLASVGSKGKVLNGLDSNVGVSVENKETLINGDELNEEELMDTLDS